MRLFVPLILSVCFAPIAAAQPPAKDLFGDPLPKGAIARIGTTRYRMGTDEKPPLLSPDGTLLALGFDIWEVPAWKKRLDLGKNITGDSSPYYSYVFTADSKSLVGYDGENGQIELIDLASGKIRKKLSLAAERTFGPSSVLLISRDEKTLVCGGLTKEKATDVLVWDLVKDKRKHAIAISASPDSRHSRFALSSDGKQMIHIQVIDPKMRPGFEKEMRYSVLEFWNLDTGRPIRKIETAHWAGAFTYSPDGKLLAIYTDQPVLRIYETATGIELHNIRIRRSYNNRVLIFTPDGQSLYFGEEDKICKWNVLTGQRGVTFSVPRVHGYYSQLAFSPQGKVRGLHQFNKALVLWDVTSGKVLSPVDAPTNAIKELCFTPGGELFVNSIGDEAGWWDPRSGRKKNAQPFLGKERDEFVYWGYTGRMAPNGDFFAYATNTCLSLLDIKAGERLYDDRTYYYSLDTIAFFDQGQCIAGIHEQTVRLWHSRNGRDFAKFELPLQPKEQPQHMAVSNDGKQFAIATLMEQEQGRVILWDREQEKIVREWPWPVGSPTKTLAFSPDNRWLAVAGQQGRLQLSRVRHGKADSNLAVAKEGFNLTHIAFSPDSRQLACALAVPVQGVDAGKIFIYEVASKKIRIELPGHAGGIIHRLAYSHDGALLASGSADTTALVWRAGLRAFAETRHEPEALATAYAKMAGADAKAAFQAMIQLAQAPKDAVALLEQKIAPAQKPDTGGRTLAQWIDDLGSANFAVRNKASAMLQKLGPEAEDALRAAAAKPRDLEAKRRLEELLERIAGRALTPQEILHVRAVEVLEAIATPEARRALARWSAGHATVVLTDEARKALARLR